MSFYWMAFLILLNTINKGISVGFSNELSYDGNEISRSVLKWKGILDKLWSISIQMGVVN